MSPQRRIALVSVGAAVVLIAIKLVTGLATGSLGLLSEAAHSGTDLVAALLTLFAVGVAVRPADRGHPYGHDKAEHLSALAEAGILGLISLFIAYAAVVASSTARGRSTRPGGRSSSSAWSSQSMRAGHGLPPCGPAVHQPRLRSERAAFRRRPRRLDGGARRAHLRRGGLPRGRRDRRALRRRPRPLRRLAADPPERRRAHGSGAGGRGRGRPRGRSRRSRRGSSSSACACAGRREGISPTSSSASHLGPRVGQGHAAADAVEEAVERGVPGSDVVVHVEPARARRQWASGRSRPRWVPGVREIHNVTVLDLDGRTEVSLHLKLPGELPLDEAHEIAEQVEREIRSSLREVTPCRRTSSRCPSRRRRATEVESESRAVGEIVREDDRHRPARAPVPRTDRGLVAFLTLAMAPGAHSPRPTRARAGSRSGSGAISRRSWT